MPLANELSSLYDTDQVISSTVSEYKEGIRAVPLAISATSIKFRSRFGPGPACDSVPIKFYSRPVRNSLSHPAFNPDFVTSHNSDLDEAGSEGAEKMLQLTNADFCQRSISQKFRNTEIQFWKTGGVYRPAGVRAGGFNFVETPSGYPFRRKSVQLIAGVKRRALGLQGNTKSQGPAITDSGPSSSRAAVSPPEIASDRIARRRASRRAHKAILLRRSGRDVNGQRLIRIRDDYRSSGQLSSNPDLGPRRA
ncbi:hypothetical protein EVAR_12347_1 [Eumeta japonica]|uniref:Uncharacterized protein n=1 Tax=Eumeta variegata TaxID=151549 RepID=A0A4C1WYX4_EUMVA|nr:hypothetical protein EVAR_12347_1 [Eumeta japonica]